MNDLVTSALPADRMGPMGEIGRMGVMNDVVTSAPTQDTGRYKATPRALELLLCAEAIAAAEALNRQAPTTLRVNTLRGPRRRLLEKIPDAVATQYSPWGVELPRRMNVHELPGFDEGWFEIQEEASQ